MPVIVTVLSMRLTGRYIQKQGRVGVPALSHGLGCLSASTGPAVCTYEASFLIDEALVTAYRAGLSLGLGAVDYVFLQGALDTVFPGVDALVFELQRADELDDMVNGHSVTQDA